MNKNNFFHQNSMFKGAPPENFAKAEILRNNMTPAEKKLWDKLKELENLKFRRQHPIHLFIVDFYCHEHRLVIEIDGEYHNNSDQVKKDAERSELLIFQDLKILRFTNKEVLENTEDVLRKIVDKIQRN